MNRGELPGHWDVWTQGAIPGVPWDDFKRLQGLPRPSIGSQRTREPFALFATLPPSPLAAPPSLTPLGQSQLPLSTAASLLPLRPLLQLTQHWALLNGSEMREHACPRAFALAVLSNLDALFLEIWGALLSLPSELCSNSQRPLARQHPLLHLHFFPSPASAFNIVLSLISPSLSSRT